MTIRMNRFYGVVALLAAGIFMLTPLTSCNKEKEKEPEHVVVDGAIEAEVSEVSFGGDGGEKKFMIISTGAWKVASYPEWVSVSLLEGRGNKSLFLTAQANPDETPREGALVAVLTGDESKSVSVKISQLAKGQSDKPDPDTPDPGPDDSSVVIERSAFTMTTDWGVTGSIMGLEWTRDVAMMEEPEYGWKAAFDIVVEAGEELKFRQGGNWDNGNLGAGAGQPAIDTRYALADQGGNIKLAAGTYDLYVHTTFNLLYVEKAGDVFSHGDAVANQEVGENTRIYILNNSDWTKPFLYAYAAGGSLQPNGSWPGTYAAGTKVYGDYTWTYWEASGFNGVGGIYLILNNNGTQQHPAMDVEEPLWSNLTIHNSLYFVWDGSKVTQVENPSEPGVSGKGIAPDEMRFGTSSWTVIGTFGGTNWDEDFPMDTEGYWEVAREFTVGSGEMFKFRQNKGWANNLGVGEPSDDPRTVTAGSKVDLQMNGGNITIAPGTYDIYIATENKLAYFLPTGSQWTHEAEGKPDYGTAGEYDPNLNPSLKKSGLTYQVNVFSFKDSNGDGYGDFNGLAQSLDYFDKMGVTALWLSPIQPAQSYHGYDITDYEIVNPRFGTEEDFQNLIDKAHEHNIRIYMDYVINHSGDQNKWFLDVKEKGIASPYWNYYSLSKNPEADVNAGKIDQIPAGWYNAGKWFPVLIGGKGAKRFKVDLDWSNSSAPTITVSETTGPVTDASTASYKNSARYLFWGNSTYTQFADNGTNKYTLTLDFNSDWGCLVRTTTADDWSSGTKWGFNKSGDQLKDGVPHTLYSGNSDDVQNIVMPGGELYYYYTEFGTGMFVDFNYGKASNCQNSAAFKAIMTGVDKWLSMGVDGFRLDAVKHIYCNETGPENKQFWKAFYDASNKLYKKYASKRSGLSGIVDENIFMVGEVLSGDGDCTPFYSGLPALFEFQFWWDLRECLNGESIWNAGYGQNFPGSLKYRWDNHQGVRSDAISTPKLANHDEDRTASTLGNYKPKIRLAASVLLTAAGRPYIYQGEELGYWGTKAGGDEYVRTPILWTPSRNSAATKALSGKVDWDMLKPAISVESQSEDESSLLMLYRRFGYARSTNPALANGWPEPDERTMNGYDGHIAGWYLHQIGGEKVVLVMHNFSGYTTDVTRWPGDNVSNSTILVANGKVSVRSGSDGPIVSMPPYSSVVFQLN